MAVRFHAPKVVGIISSCKILVCATSESVVIGANPHSSSDLNRIEVVLFIKEEFRRLVSKAGFVVISETMHKLCTLCSRVIRTVMRSS